ncbi:hypothetical protein D1AOALGA4SA_4173 [Olavius algarvensis Delta 1 endosymbiont]|nr:hypothetical protein D1AOALGA4SA_4173 [Olavius algarvensis Delta 1 endosymbiont]
MNKNSALGKLRRAKSECGSGNAAFDGLRRGKVGNCWNSEAKIK